MPSMLQSIKKKLHPGRFTGCSPKMAAIIGCILQEQYTEPQLISFCVTSDNCVLAMQAGDIGFNQFMGPLSEFQRNWTNLLNAADDLTKAERKKAEQLFNTAMRRV